MVFEVSTAKQEILEKLAEQDWTPTDLAEELGKSRTTVYNHLNELHQNGILTKQKVAAKTRPKTEYSIGNGFIQYVSVLPGQYQEKTLELTPEKQAALRIWNIPQEKFHPFIEHYWWSIKNSADLDYRDEIKAVAVYGSVARGNADQDSDIDFLVITKDEDTADTVSTNFGSLRIKANGTAKIGLTEVYSMKDYKNSLAHGSKFLENVRDELHAIYDPEKVLQNPEKVIRNEQ